MQLHEKLTRILNSAKCLFIVPGYSDTKMLDIAKQSGLAVGTLYSLFASKDDLLEFVFAATLDPDYIDNVQSLPLTLPTHTDLLTHTKQVYQVETQALNDLLTNFQADARFEAMLTYLFKNFNRFGAYFMILERNPQMNPELMQLYRLYRKQLYHEISTFLVTLVMNGEVRYLAAPDNDAMIIIDEIFWWSAHKKYDSFEPADRNYDVSTMQASVMKQLITSYI